jgi:hypothetical protein
MANKSQNQHVPVEKTSEPWPYITNGSVTIAHSATIQTEGWRAGDRTQERTRYIKGIFLTRSKIHHKGIKLETLRCYSGGSTIWAEDLWHDA